MLSSIAIAGAWGYIGRKLLDAALSMGLRVYVCDPGRRPDDVDPASIEHVDDAVAFYRLEVDLFHLALHPHHRDLALDLLLRRAAAESLLILNEKPMASPQRPRDCGDLIRSLDDSRAVMLFDFPELFDPMTQRLIAYLRSFDRLEITEIQMQRSKDREDPGNRRNDKEIVHIQYQESVHCLAFVLNLLGQVEGSIDGALAPGLAVAATARPYTPPNPEAYPFVVDGQCRWEITSGEMAIGGVTDFTRGAAWSKRRTIEGIGDGRPFVIEADYLEGSKYLVIDGVDQGIDPGASSYESIIATLGCWRESIGDEELRRGLYPNPAFAQLTYQLSSALWKSSREGRTIALDSVDALRAFDAGFASAVTGFARYPKAGETEPRDLP